MFVGRELRFPAQNLRNGTCIEGFVPLAMIALNVPEHRSNAAIYHAASQMSISTTRSEVTQKSSSLIPRKGSAVVRDLRAGAANSESGLPGVVD